MVLKTPLVAAALAALLCAPALAQTPPAAPKQPTQREAWNAPFEPFHLIDNVYYVGTGGLASYLFKTSDGLIVLDAFSSDSIPIHLLTVEALRMALSKLAPGGAGWGAYCTGAEILSSR